MSIFYIDNDTNYGDLKDIDEGEIDNNKKSSKRFLKMMKSDFKDCHFLSANLVSKIAMNNK